jgi:hypothetical protein
MLTNYTLIEMNFPPHWTGKEEIIPCNLKDPPSNVVNKVEEGVRSGELMDFQQDRDMTHVEAPSSTTFLLITCFMYTTSI